MTREHRVSRRVLLGAACIGTLAASGGAFPSPSFQRRLESQRRWNRALAHLRRAELALAAAAREPDEERYGNVLVVFNAALKRLLRAPAPDLPGLAAKLTLALRESAWELTGGEACMAALARDAHRLARCAHAQAGR